MNKPPVTPAKGVSGIKLSIMTEKDKWREVSQAAARANYLLMNLDENNAGEFINSCYQLFGCIERYNGG